MLTPTAATVSISAMTGYELLLTLHIITATIWLGAGFLFAVLVLGAERAGDGAREAGYHRDVGWLAPRLFIPSSLATLIVGILLVIDGSWGFDQLWVLIGIAGWAASFGLGFFYFKPEGERIGAIAAERGPADPELVWRIKRLNVVDRFQLVILFTVIADMVIKPTGDDGGVLAVGAALILLAGGVAMTSVRRRQQQLAT